MPNASEISNKKLGLTCLPLLRIVLGYLGMLSMSDEDDLIFELDRKSGVPRKRVKYTEQYAIDEVKRFAEAHPVEQLTAGTYELWSKRDGNRHSLAKVFGGWTQLMQAAGIGNDRYSNKVISDEYCITYFEKVWRWKRKQPSATDLKIYGKDHPGVIPISAHTFMRRWGGLPRFAKLFVQFKNGQITKSELLNKKSNSKKREPISPRLRAEVLKRDNKKCQDCGKSANNGVKLEVHHVIPVSKGGKSTIENLITNCEICNRGKSDKVLD